MAEVIRTYYDNGNLYEEYFKINGIKHGEYKSYHSNGQLHVICNYVNDKIEGEYKHYRENGNLEVVYNYVNDKKHGDYKIFNVKINTKELLDHEQKIIEKKYENNYPLHHFMMGKGKSSIITPSSSLITLHIAEISS